MLISEALLSAPTLIYFNTRAPTRALLYSLVKYASKMFLTITASHLVTTVIYGDQPINEGKNQDEHVTPQPLALVDLPFAK